MYNPISIAPLSESQILKALKGFLYVYRQVINMILHYQQNNLKSLQKLTKKEKLQR